MYNKRLKICFTVLTSQLELVLKEKHIQAPATSSVSAFPHAVVSGSPREFLFPNSALPHIPGERKARMKDAEHTVYRKALYISKAAFDTANSIA